MVSPSGALSVLSIALLLLIIYFILFGIIVGTHRRRCR